MAEKAASQRGKGRFPTFGENLWDNPGEKSGENSGKDFWGIKNGCGKPLGKGSFGKSSEEINGGIMHYKKSALNTIDLYIEKEAVPGMSIMSMRHTQENSTTGKNNQRSKFSRSFIHSSKIASR